MIPLEYIPPLFNIHYWAEVMVAFREEVVGDALDTF